MGNENKKNDQAAAREASLSAPICSAGTITLADLVRIHNAGYNRGHHDTVEAGYVDIHRDDEATYHEEEVSELLTEMGIAMSNDTPTPKAGQDYRPNAKDTRAATQTPKTKD